MIRILFAFLMAVLIPVSFISAQEALAPVDTPEAVTETVSEDFKVYLLIKAGLVKKQKKPEFAYRQLKSYPMKVREFLLNSKYTVFSGNEFKEHADGIVSVLSGAQKKNAVLVAAEVFNYVSLSITTVEKLPVPGMTQSESYALPLEAMRSKTAGLLEKNRLAAALLRYHNIPARIAFWDDRHVVQYFLKPLESEKIDAAWHVMDFTGAYGAALGMVEPVAWHPVTAEELLGESWENSELSLIIKEVKNSRMEINEAEALALFTNIEKGNIPEMESRTAVNKYYLLKEITYEATVPNTIKSLKMELTLPFNETQPFKTLRYTVKGSENLKPKFRKTHTMINPPNSGLVYTLPVELEFLKSH